MHAGPDRLDVAVCRLPVELDRRGQIHFRDDCNVGAVENCGVLEGLILTLRDRDQYESEILAEIIGGRTYQVPHILDKKEIKLVEIPRLEGVLDHSRFEMTECTRGDLLDRSLAAGQPCRIVIRGEIANEGGDTIILTKQRECLFQEHGFA